MAGSKFSVYDIAIIAVLSAIIFVQEEALTFIPNVQLTVFLLILYSKKLGLRKTTIILLIHVILDNLYMNSFNIYFTPAMFLGWFMIPLITSTLLKKIESSALLALFGALFAFIYCWIMMIPTAYLFKMDMLAYFISDIPFEIILAVSSFVTTILLYKPCGKVLDMLYKKIDDRRSKRRKEKELS